MNTNFTKSRSLSKCAPLHMPYLVNTNIYFYGDIFIQLLYSKIFEYIKWIFCLLNFNSLKNISVYMVHVSDLNTSICNLDN